MTIKVELRYPWFAPSDMSLSAKIGRGLYVGGRRYRKGIHVLPDSAKPFLPSSARIIEDSEVKSEEPVDEMKEADVDRAAAEIEAAVNLEVDEELEGRRRAFAEELEAETKSKGKRGK